MTRRSTKALLGILLAIALGNVGRIPTVLADDQGPRLWLARPVRHQAHFGGDPAVTAIPLALAADDFDGDGVGDLVAGYRTQDTGMIAFFRGNLDAFAPQSDASFWAIARNEFPSPYLPDAEV